MGEHGLGRPRAGRRSAILPGMAANPRIAIVGAGNLATALALSLHRAAYEIDAIVARSAGGSLRKAQRLAKQVGSRAVAGLTNSVRSDVIWLCVPDSEIGVAARAAATKIDWEGKVALHSSGALTSEELAPLRRRGAAVASAHPLMTFARGSSSGRLNFGQSSLSLAGVPFAVEGDAKAVRVARGLIAAMGGQAYAIRKRDKVAYHAWGMFASPLLDALLAATERVAAAASVRPKEARRRMIPILLQTLANYASFGGPGSFSGPIVRGDVDTVRKHLRVLRNDPTLLDVYTALARAALEYLPAKKKDQLRQVLGSDPRGRAARR